MISRMIEELLYYAIRHLHLNEEDVIFYRNYLMSEFNVKAPYDGEIDYKSIDEMIVPDTLVEQFMNYCINDGLSEKEAEAKVTKIFGMLSPIPSKTIETFNALYNVDKRLATDYLYDLGIKSNYIQKTKIEQNVVIPGEVDGNEIVMTINLSKPEKSNKDIKAALAKPVGDVAYPACPICITNEGCIGSAKTAPRGNLRLIPMELAGNTWYLQYSPYGYYNEHCILILKEHLPMVVKKEYLAALFEFVDLFPHYFIGANSDLPIVGGSILSHEHFQGGNYVLPLMKVKDKILLKGRRDDVVYSILDWPATCFALRGKDKKILLDEADNFVQTWKKFTFEKANIICSTSEQHSTVTSIVTKKEETYTVYLMPRNNLTSEELPGGLYHVRPELQIIKNEGIGLIEAMGLFILPARLKRQLKLVEEIVKNPSKREEIYQNYEDMKAFDHIINEMIEGKFNSIDDLLFYTGNGILHDINVFKDERYGNEALNCFLKELELCKQD